MVALSTCLLSTGRLFVCQPVDYSDDPNEVRVSIFPG